MRKLPAYPLFVKDPYFSIWADTEILTERDTMFWHGEPKPIYGSVMVDGKAYRFMGKGRDSEALEQVSLTVKAFTTTYGFTCADFDFEAEFLSPLPPDDIELASTPACFLGYKLKPKRQLNTVSVTIEIEERICYNTCYHAQRRETLRGGVLKRDGYESAYFGLRRQMPLSHSADEFGSDWGYYYVAGKECRYYESAGMQYISATDTYTDVAQELSGKFVLAYDDLVSIFYFGEWLRGYYFRDGKTIMDAIDESYAGYHEVREKCDVFDRKLIEPAKVFGEEYLLILYAALRQSMAAHKIVQNAKGQVLFLSKECNSDGCIATLDVSYPSAPLYLLYNPELVNGMLYPIFEFARCDVWEHDFAPHDVGIFPYCLGQLYGAFNQDNKYHSDIYINNWHTQESLPMFYLFPKGSNVYAMSHQMPIEECGNVLILAASACLAGGSKDIIEENFDLLKKWADYLCENGTVPENQLCTDDFAGHLEKNANLSVKACLGIAAFTAICNAVHKKDLAQKYLEKARKHAQEWMVLCSRKQPGTPITVDGNGTSFSLKYNLVFDKLFGTNLFDQQLFETEVDLYLEKQNEYGTPLDSRADYTKSDWLVWAASLTDDLERSKRLMSPIVKYLKQSPDRVPFGDWYETKTGTYCMFRNRPVLGGVFMPLLLASGKLKFEKTK